VQEQTREQFEPIWVRPRPGARMAGCGLTKFYELMNSGKIKSVKVDGMRLAEVASIKALGTAATE
jgi:hypothetical protein